VARLLAAHAARARCRLDLAIYDLKLDDASGRLLCVALERARARGVAVRLLFNQDPPRPRPRAALASEVSARAELPFPAFVDRELLRRLRVPSRSVPGGSGLMHHKYAVADAGRPGAAVWTGSANWTEHAWSREENVIVRVVCEPLALAYQENFEELWETRSVRRSGLRPRSAWARVDPEHRVRAFFTPGQAQDLVGEIVQLIEAAQRRVRFCSPVLTSPPVLAALAAAAARPGLDLCGCVDATLMAGIAARWARAPASRWKLEAWEALRGRGRWGGKRSAPYGLGAERDLMHAKCLVVDNTALLGSYNFSRGGERNAENVLEIEGRSLADRVAGFVEGLARRYGA
jgi:phosphatidylserine/phosphatidylglycerophosphate/cardiolipin synthase-like enzyme